MTRTYEITMRDGPTLTVTSDIYGTVTACCTLLKRYPDAVCVGCVDG